MASMKDIKRRKGSIQSTQQITKAMKLVSTVKLQKSKAKAEEGSPYFQHMYHTVSSILAQTKNVTHPYLTGGNSKKIAVITITGNRGLAGGYNSNVVKQILGSSLNKEDVLIYAIGNKGKDALARKGYEIFKDASEIIEAPSFTDAKAVCEDILQSFTKGEIGEIYLAYTHFKNTVVHEPKLLKLLPVEVEESTEEESGGTKAIMNFEPSVEETLDLMIPKYITSLIYGALSEALASENGARMQAMESATKNAEEIISDLTLKYNRARQGSITQELTEIIAGAEAIS